jgi:hypothetical protein
MGIIDGSYKKFMKDNLNLDTDMSRKKSKSTKLLNKVPEIEVENRLNIQYLRGRQQIRDLTEDEQVYKVETNTDLKPLKALPKGYDYGKMAKGKHNMTRHDLLSLRYKTNQDIKMKSN